MRSRSSALPIVRPLPLAGGAAPGICAGNMARWWLWLLGARFASGGRGAGGAAERGGAKVMGSFPAARDEGGGRALGRDLGSGSGGGIAGGGGSRTSSSSVGALFFFFFFDFFLGAGSLTSIDSTSSLAYSSWKSSSSSSSFTSTTDPNPFSPGTAAACMPGDGRCPLRPFLVSGRSASIGASTNIDGSSVRGDEYVWLSLPGRCRCDACAACASCCATAIMACVDACRGSALGFAPGSARWPSGRALRINVRRCAGSEVQYASSSGSPAGSASMRRYRSLAVASRSAWTCAVAASDGALSSSASPARFVFFFFFFEAFVGRWGIATLSASGGDIGRSSMTAAAASVARGLAIFS